MPLINRMPPKAPRRSFSRATCASFAVALLAVGACFTGAAAQSLPVPSQGLPGYVNGSQEVPDPGLVYKVAFDISSAGPIDKVHPSLARVARYLNTLAEYGVPPVRRQLTIVLHGAATQCVLRDAAFVARSHGHANPNRALIESMRQAGVVIRVSGQEMLAQHVTPRDLLPSVQIDLGSLSTLINLQLHGYVAVGE